MVQVANKHCSHSHHDHESGSPREGAPGDSGQEGDGHHDDCDEGDCSFASAQRSCDLVLILMFSMWCQTLGDAAHADAIISLDALNLAADSPPDPLMDSGSARALSQVWRL